MRIRLFLLLLPLLCLSPQVFAQDTNPPIYSEVIPTSSGLPFNPATDFREQFRAPNGELVEALVKGPIGDGTYTRAIKSGETPDIYFPAVVSEAVAAGAHHLIIPKGKYLFHGPTLCTDLDSPACNQPSSCNVNQYWNCTPHWTIGEYPEGQVEEPNSITDLDIDLSGSELDFSAPVIGLWILEAQRIRLRNFTIDWPSLPIASLGTIVRDPENPGHNALVLDEQYPVKDKYQGGPVQIQAVDPWDESKQDPPGYFDAKSNNTYEVYFIFGNAPQPTYVGKTSAGAHTFSCKSCHFENSSSDPTCSFFNGCANFDSFTPGSRVLVRHYTYNGFAIAIDWVNDIDFENVTVRTGPGIGIAVANNGGYRGFRLANSKIVRGPGRLISTASDALDVSQKADVIITNNDIGYQGDDSMAVYQTTFPVNVVDGKQIETNTVCDPDPMDQPGRGDILALFDANYNYLGSAHVTAASNVFCGPALTLTLDHATPGLKSGGNLVDLSQYATARYIVHDNVMHECRCHGALVDAPYGSIHHNLMYRNSAGGIQSQGGQYGPGATNLSITANGIGLTGQSTQYYGAITLLATDTNGNPLPAPAYQKIKIDDNLFYDTPGPAIVATSTRYFSMERNWIINSNQARTQPVDFGDLTSFDSIVLYLSSHGSVCGTDREGRTTGPIGVDPKGSFITVEQYCSSNALQ